MLHVVGEAARDRDSVMRGMFEARKQVFVDLLKWDVPVVEGRFEIDQFDDAHAVYLVLTDGAGRHRASTRLLPTTRLHILGDLYPALCAGPVPCGPDTMEITRFCLDRWLTTADRRRARNGLVSAIADFALANGVRCYTGVAELGWLQQILAFGWRCRPLGLPSRHGGALLGALAIDIDDDTPALLARAGIYTACNQEMRDAA